MKRAPPRPVWATYFKKATVCVLLFNVIMVLYLLCTRASTPCPATQPTPQPQLAAAHDICAARPAVALLMVILGHESSARHDQYWLAVANRRAYAVTHGYPLYLVNEKLGSGQHPAWEKLVAVQGVFQHSCASWVWLSDADAYIMTLGLDVSYLAADPTQHRHPARHCSTNTPDIIVAGACLTHVNTGSMLLRNSNWTRQFVQDAWHSKFIAKPVNWWDQAAVLHLYKQGDTRKHFCIVKQRAINALPSKSGCHDGHGTYQEGDLLVHYPGGLKSLISQPGSATLKSIPILPDAPADAMKSARLFTISARAPSRVRGLILTVHVRMQSSMYADKSAMPKEFNLWFSPQDGGHDNWGWPIAPAPAYHWENVQNALRKKTSWPLQA